MLVKLHLIPRSRVRIPAVPFVWDRSSVGRARDFVSQILVVALVQTVHPSPETLARECGENNRQKGAPLNSYERSKEIKWFRNLASLSAVPLGAGRLRRMVL